MIQTKEYIFEKIGLDTDSSLKDLKQLRPHYLSDEVKCGNCFVLKKDSILVETDTDIKLQQIKMNQKSIGWKVKLKKYSSVEKSTFCDNFWCEGRRKKISNSIDELSIKSNKSRVLIHRGHLLAKEFKPYYIGSKNSFNFSYHNPDNIFPQWSRANLNSNKEHGQAYFEIAIRNLFRNHSDEDVQVYYEVEAIFKNDDTEMDVPIGNRIYVKILSEHEFKGGPFDKEFHVFVPNYQ